MHRLAVRSSLEGDDSSGDAPPGPDDLGPADVPRGRPAASTAVTVYRVVLPGVRPVNPTVRPATVVSRVPSRCTR